MLTQAEPQLRLEACWEMRVGNLPLASISASSTDLKRIQIPHSYSGISEQVNPLQLVDHLQAAESKFESKFKPLPVN